MRMVTAKSIPLWHMSPAIRLLNVFGSVVLCKDSPRHYCKTIALFGQFALFYGLLYHQTGECQPRNPERISKGGASRVICCNPSLFITPCHIMFGIVSLLFTGCLAVRSRYSVLCHFYHTGIGPPNPKTPVPHRFIKNFSIEVKTGTLRPSLTYNNRIPKEPSPTSNPRLAFPALS